MTSILHRAAVVSLVVAGLSAGPAVADEVADFYKGKTFTIVVGHEVGTGFDIYGRTLQRHLGRHIPGNPIIVVQNMVGASGINAAGLSRPLFKPQLESSDSEGDDKLLHDEHLCPREEGQ